MEYDWLFSEYPDKNFVVKRVMASDDPSFSDEDIDSVEKKLENAVEFIDDVDVLKSLVKIVEKLGEEKREKYDEEEEEFEIPSWAKMKRLKKSDESKKIHPVGNIKKEEDNPVLEFAKSYKKAKDAGMSDNEILAAERELDRVFFPGQKFRRLF